MIRTVESNKIRNVIIFILEASKCQWKDYSQSKKDKTYPLYQPKSIFCKIKLIAQYRAGDRDEREICSFLERTVKGGGGGWRREEKKTGS